MKKYEQLKEDFSDDIITIIGSAGFKIDTQNSEPDKGIIYAAFYNGKETISIEDAIRNLQKLKQKTDRSNYKFAIVQHNASLRIDVSD